MSAKPKTEEETTDAPAEETPATPASEADAVRGSGTIEDQAAAREADPSDLGVPAEAAAPGDTFNGPEDAFSADTRGDYSDRLTTGKSYSIEAIPEAERTPGGPTTRAIQQN